MVSTSSPSLLNKNCMLFVNFFFTILIMETLYVQMNAIKKNINFQVFALDLYIGSLFFFQYMVTGRDGRAGVPVL